PSAPSRPARLCKGSKPGTPTSASASMPAFFRRSACSTVLAKSPTSPTIASAKRSPAPNCLSMSISNGQPEPHAMADFEVHIGLARSNRARGSETILFEYDGAWLDDPDRFSLEPALAMTRGTFAPAAGLATFGSIGDSAPDTWGRRLMQRAERRLADREGRAVRTLMESDYLLGVADETRLRALRFHPL